MNTSPTPTSKTTSRLFAQRTLLAIRNVSLAALLPLAASTEMQAATWNAGGSGNWNTDGNWISPATYPNAAGASAFLPDFSPAATRTITLTAPVTVGSLQFGNTTASSIYLITGSTLTFEAASGNATLNFGSVTAQEIASAVTLNSDLAISGTGNVGRIISGSISAAAGRKILVNFGNYTGYVRLSGNNSSFLGNVEISGGLLRVNNAAALSANNLVTFTSNDITAQLYLEQGVTIKGLSSSLSSLTRNSVRNNGSGASRLLTLQPGTGESHAYYGYFTDGGGRSVSLLKTGAGTQILAGTSASTFNGAETQGGVLALASTGTNVFNASHVFGTDTPQGWKITTGGTLRLDASNQIVDTNVLKLNGGTFDMQAYSETLGTLLLTANSTIAIGGEGGTNRLVLADSSLLDWSDFVLTINGTINADTLRIGTSAGGLTADQLASFRFANYGNVAAQIDSLGYVTPVPEPGVAVLLAFSAFVFLGFARRGFFVKGRPVQ